MLPSHGLGCGLEKVPHLQAEMQKQSRLKDSHPYPVRRLSIGYFEQTASYLQLGEHVLGL